MFRGGPLTLRQGSDSTKSRHRKRKSSAAAREAVYSVCMAEALERRVLLSGLTTVASIVPYPLGAEPKCTLVMDGAGNLYGTTETAGAYNDGTVFEWIKATNTVMVIAAFNGARP